jgi:hypothetical protein
MNSREFFVLAIVEQAVVVGALLYLVAAWVLSRRVNSRRRQKPPQLEPFHSDEEIKPQQPFLVWMNSLPRLGESPTAPLRPLRGDGFSVHARR